MSVDWTIDTFVLYKAADGDIDPCYFLLRVIKERHTVNFDSEKQIEREYSKCFKKVQRERRVGSELLKKWFKEVVAKCYQCYSGKLQEKHKKGLEKLSFDRSDWPFVAVCKKTASKNLVSEESDYKIEVKEYLKKEMDINVLSIHDSLQYSQ